MTAVHSIRVDVDAALDAGVVVIGGGIAGATAAASAATAGARVVLVTGRTPAGRASTGEKSGFLLNRGAHGLYDHGAGRAVLERLGVPVRGAPSPLEGALGPDANSRTTLRWPGYSPTVRSSVATSTGCRS